MENALVSYQFEEAPVRVVMILDDPWFVANDVAKVLGYTQSAFMTRMLDDDEKGLHIVQTLGGQQDMNIISESGLYAAILKSRRPEAKKFRKWVTSEVLPALRRHGSYRIGGEERETEIASDYDPTRLTASVGVVREARRLFGPSAARRIWTKLGLPPAIAGSAPDMEGSELAAPLREWLADKQAVTMRQVLEGLDLSEDADMGTRRELSALLGLLGWRNRPARMGQQTVRVWTRSDGEARS